MSSVFHPDVMFQDVGTDTAPPGQGDVRRAARPRTLAGTNDNNWGVAQSVTVPIQLKKGSNTLIFGNATNYAPGIDKITV